MFLHVGSFKNIYVSTYIAIYYIYILFPFMLLGGAWELWFKVVSAFAVGMITINEDEG
jgi:hypothetical protein